MTVVDGPEDDFLPLEPFSMVQMIFGSYGKIYIPTLPGGLETSGRRVYRLYWHISRRYWVFAILLIFCVLNSFWVFGCLRTGLLCIMGELAGGGSVAVAVGVSDPRHPLMFNAECVVWPSARRLACLRQARAVGQ
jgi:hypothetical protein